MALVFFLDIYYCVIIAWTFFYFIAAFTAIPDLPWNTCGENNFCTFNKYITTKYLSRSLESVYSHFLINLNIFVLELEGWWNTKSCFLASENTTADHLLIQNHTQEVFHKHNRTTTPVEEFWE